MPLQRGEIWDAQFPLEDVQGSEPYGHGTVPIKPVVIVSSDAFNRSAIRTVIVAVITSNLKLERAPGNFLVLADDSGLQHDSVVNVSQVFVVNKTRLLEHRGKLDELGLELLRIGLRKMFDLP
jgi:mRNA interferase MazF